MNRPALFVLIIISISACNHKTGTNNVPLVHAYVYYPKPNVYFDTTEKTFIYFDSSAANWKKGSLPVNLQADMGKSVLITKPSDPVWNNNKEHRLIYSATLYADSADFKKHHPKETTVVNPNPGRKTGDGTYPPDQEIDKKREHHKVGDFLRKIFGKKKRND